jgi:hypothetical protein
LKFVLAASKGPEHEAQPVQRGADHCDPEGAGRALANGVPVSELCRMHGVSDVSIYKWKTKYGGMDVSDANRLGVAVQLALLRHPGVTLAGWLQGGFAVPVDLNPSLIRDQGNCRWSANHQI